MFKPGYCFEYFLEYVKFVIEVVSFVRNHHEIKIKVETAQDKKHLKHLAEACETCWTSILNSFQTVLESENVLATCFNFRDFVTSTPSSQKEKRKYLKEFFGKRQFYFNNEEAIDILTVLIKLIVCFQNDSLPILDVFELLETLKAQWASYNNECSCRLSNAEKSFLMNLIYGDCHSLAYILNPRYLGHRMTPEFKEEIEEYLLDYFNDASLSEEENTITKYAIVEEYRNFKEKIFL